MQQRGCCDHAGEDAFNVLYSKVRIEISDGAVGENQADIKSDERAAASEHEAHESADVAVFLDAIAIVDPDQREVLHVVKNFEQRNAYNNVRDKIITVPPKCDARNKQSQFHGIGPVPYKPHPSEVQDKKPRNDDRHQKNQLLAVMNY